MPGDKRSANPEHNVKKRKKLELQGNQAKAVGKGFQDLPPEVIGIIMGYCSTEDKKEMRCVSKWCFIVVSTASKTLKSLFGTYKIKSVHNRNYSQISEVLSNAIKRSYGPKVRLDLQLNPPPGNIFLLIKGVLTSGQIKEILTSLKENISALGISLNIYPEILLQPHLDFKNIRRLDISFQSVDEGLHKNICEAILARYSDKLEHLGVKYLKIPNNTVLQVPRLSKLKSLALKYNDLNIVNTFVNAANNGTITNFFLAFSKPVNEQLDLIFPTLQHLEFSGESAMVSDLIKRHKNTIKSLNLALDSGDIGDIDIPNLSNLEIMNVKALSLMKCYKNTITRLKLRFIINLTYSNIGDIKIPNLQYLDLCLIPGDVALSLIKNNKDTLCEIRLYISSDGFTNISLPVVEMPRLKRLYERVRGNTSKLKLIKAFGRNIEELWSYDSNKESYIRKSRKELKDLKLKALALQ